MFNYEQLDFLKKCYEPLVKYLEDNSVNTRDGEISLKLAEQCRDTWNKRREENPDLRIDLSRADLLRANLWAADLSKADLSGADLSGADLRKANLREANLSSADLREADLLAADLREADLSGANLRGANLCRANLRWLRGTNLLRWGEFGKVNLSEADLREADLREAELSEADLSGADLSGADLRNANLRGANLRGANLCGANLRGANLRWGILDKVNLSEANLREANLREVNLRAADLSGAYLNGANLSNATLIGVDFVRAEIGDAIISNSKIYGVNVWDLEGEFKEQNQLIISKEGESIITVDNIKVAQFVYLILNNKEIRDVLNTLTTRTVLILGRFTEDRKLILDALRDKLREEGFLPILFDFERSDDRDYTETIKTLVGLCYFVIADVTDPSSIPLELQATVPEFQIPFVPIIQKGNERDNKPFAMMQNLQTKYSWMLPTKTYDSLDHLMERLKEGIIEPAKEEHERLRGNKAQKPSLDSL